MKTASRFLATLFLIAAGSLMVLAAVVSFIASTGILNDPAVGWWHWEDPASRNAMITFGFAVLYCILALTAFVAIFRGRRSILLFLFSLLLLVMPIYTIVTRVQDGTLTGTWEQIGSLILEFLVPILYFLGTIMLVRADDM